MNKLFYDYVGKGLGEHKIYKKKSIFGQAKYGVVDVKNKTILPFAYDEVRVMSGRYVANAKHKNLYTPRGSWADCQRYFAIYDDNGQALTEHKYQNVSILGDGGAILAEISHDPIFENSGKALVLNDKCEEITPYFDKIYNLQGQGINRKLYVGVKAGEKSKIFDVNGKMDDYLNENIEGVLVKNSFGARSLLRNLSTQDYFSGNKQIEMTK